MSEGDTPVDEPLHDGLGLHVARELRRLTTQNKRYKEALEEIADRKPEYRRDGHGLCWDVSPLGLYLLARQALEPERSIGESNHERLVQR